MEQIIEGFVQGVTERDAQLSNPIRNLRVEGHPDYEFANLKYNYYNEDTGRWGLHELEEEFINSLPERIYESGSDFNEHIKTVDDLQAILDDGTKVLGESLIPLKNGKINEINLIPSNAKGSESAKNSLSNADVIIVGPGSLYTSIIPPLLVKDITKIVK